MPITSFQRALLVTGGAVGALGAGGAILVVRERRQDAAETAYVARAVPVEEFAANAIDAFDRGTYQDPFDPNFESYAAMEDRDGVLSLGIEDTVRSQSAFHREIADPAAIGYADVLSGRSFLRRADGDRDGAVTKPELVAALRPFAGPDRALDAKERRTVMLDEGLTTRVEEAMQPKIAGWGVGAYDEEPVRTAAVAAEQVLRELVPYGEARLRIDEHAVVIPWTNDGTRLQTGDILSRRPTLEQIDTAGNGDGVVSARELATWIGEEFRDESLVPGHVQATTEDMIARLGSQRLGRVDTSTVRGRIFYDTAVPAADVDRYYGGDVRSYLDAIEGVRAARGDADWEPDPTSGRG